MSVGTDVFLRKATGLTRQVSPLDTLVYATINPGLLFSMVYIMWAPFLYPGCHMPWAVLTVLQMFPIAGLYWLLSCSMPRSGGEYIYISRILHPTIGMMSSFMISFTAISWTGILTDWWIRWSLADFFRGLWLLNNSENLLYWANFFDNPHVRAIIGTLSILTIFYIYYRGTRWMIGLAWFTLVMAVAGVITFLVASFIGGGNVGFVANWNAMTGVKYDDVLKAAADGGYPLKFILVATIMGGSTYVVLNTLGATFSANLAGEVRNVQRSQLLALFGSLAIQMTCWFVVYYMAYANWGPLFTNALMFLFNTGHDLYPWGSAEPFATLMVAIMTKSALFVFLIAITFFVATYGSAAGLGFGPTRNIFAWAFDRLIPPVFAEVDPKTRSPIYCIIVAIVGAEIFLLMNIYAPTWTANIAYTIFAWFVAWVFLGIAGIVFPYRRKILFESSPPVVKSRLLGIPVVTILGVVTTLISLSITIYLLIPFAKGDLPYTMLILVGVFAVLPFIAYYLSRNIYRQRGVALDMQFKEIPPE
ncbi:MAG: APC family permease [Desulfotomaculales bacterium]